MELMVGAERVRHADGSFVKVRTDEESHQIRLAKCRRYNKTEAYRKSLKKSQDKKNGIIAPVKRKLLSLAGKG